MIDGKRPERVLMKSGSQTVTCKCGHSFTVPDNKRSALCPRCSQTMNWGLSK